MTNDVSYKAIRRLADWQFSEDKLRGALADLVNGISRCDAAEVWGHVALFGLFAEVERDLISERTKEALAAAKAKGKLLGRPHRVCRTQASGRPWAEESLLPSDPRARPRLQDRVHPRLPEPAGASHADPTRAPQGRTATRGRDVAKRA